LNVANNKVLDIQQIEFYREGQGFLLNKKHFCIENFYFQM